MNCAKGILSALAASLLALVVGFWPAIQEIFSQKQTAIGAFAGGISNLVFSPLPWLVLAVCSLAFFRASQFESKAMRISFFWVPALTFSTVLVAGATLYILIFGFLLSRTQ